jgi:hypothetical protein
VAEMTEGEAAVMALRNKATVLLVVEEEEEKSLGVEEVGAEKAFSEVLAVAEAAGEEIREAVDILLVLEILAAVEREAAF